MPKKQQCIGPLRTFMVGEIEVRVGKVNLLAKSQPFPYALSIFAQMPAGYRIEVQLCSGAEAERNQAFEAFDQARAELFTTGPITDFLRA
jgi:hypothetical protein